MQKVNANKVLGYVVLPGIKPRLGRLVGTGFSFFSVLMAQIYVMVGLLPYDHPYIRPENKGRFGIRHVIAEAANNLVLSRKNLDKIFMFVAVLAGAVMLVMQFVMLLGMFLVNFAWAGPIPIGNLFDTLSPQDDIAFNIMVLVFGVPDFFCSSSAPATCATSNALVPYTIHDGLHVLFRFYSFGILLIAVLIFLYFVVVVIAETAVTGSPFGRRFQNVWVPVRIVMALFLLVPINYGLNSGQYLVLYSAKLGSSLATNGWLRYNNTIADHDHFSGGGANPMGERETLIGLPRFESFSSVAASMSLVHTCAYSYWQQQGQPPVGAGRSFAAGHYQYPGVRPPGAPIGAYFVKTTPNTFPAPGPATRYGFLPGTTFQQALNFYGNGDIKIVFGEYMPGDNAYQETGQVKPACGSITIPVTSAAGVSGGTPSAAAQVAEVYFDAIKQMWFRGNGHADELRRGAILLYENTVNEADRATRTCNGTEACGGETGISCSQTIAGTVLRQCAFSTPVKDWTNTIVTNFNTNYINPELLVVWQDFVANSDLAIEAAILNRGWAGAGMWFTRLADLNGSFQSAISAIPMMDKYPMTMEYVRTELKKENPGITGSDSFAPNLTNSRQVTLVAPDLNRAKALHKTYKLWNDDGIAGGNAEKEVIYNVFMDMMNMLLGTDALFDIRGANVHTHPLVQLIQIGKGLVDSTIRNLALASGAGIIKALTDKLDTVVGAASGILTSTAFLGLTAGLVLYYVVPFLPFIYFFFAVASWVKTVFEAMVGVPLWALAHLRLDGEGLPGESASNGYFLILEVGVRPILTVLGLIAAIIIFTAQVRVLHFIWDIVVENVSGYSNTSPVALDPDYFDAGAITERDSFKRGVIDQFFYTIIYTIIVYMLATASFKLIDAIPDNIMRWGGIGVSAFSDINQESSVESVQRYVAMGGMVQGEKIGQGVVGLSQGTGGALGQMLGTRGVRGGGAPPAGG